MSKKEHITELLSHLEGLTGKDIPNYDPDNELDVTPDQIHRDIIQSLREVVNGDFTSYKYEREITKN